MSTQKLFGNNVQPACQYCTEAMQRMGDSVLCLKKGIMPLTHSCKKFSYDPLKRVPPRPQTLLSFKEEDFSIT